MVGPVLEIEVFRFDLQPRTTSSVKFRVHPAVHVNREEVTLDRAGVRLGADVRFVGGIDLCKPNYKAWNYSACTREGDFFEI